VPTLIEPQARFLALPHKFRAYVSGFGAGKTWAGCAGLCQMAWQHPRVNNGYFAPSYPQIRDIFFPTIEEVAEDWGLNTQIRKGDKEVDLYSGRKYRSTIICRSMDVPGSIVGFKIGRGLVDEIDTMPADKATSAWRKIIARLRLKFDGVNGVDLTTTPEGFRFTYEQFVKQPRENPAAAGMYGLIQASTYDNEANLPADYIPSLLASYPANLVEAYINGQFVNLAHGTVYVQYDRKLNRSAETIQKDDVLYIGMDFNVGKMAAVVHVKRGGNPHAVDELVDRYDTPDMIQAIKERYWPYVDGQYQKKHQIRVYPDSSGGGRRTVNASETDIQLLEQAGFMVSAPKANPPVRNRINSMNAMFCNAMGERRYFVNDDKCPTYADNLEQQAYNEQGEPDKKSGKDHSPDAGGYFIHRDYPLERPVTNLNLRFAM